MDVETLSRLQFALTIMFHYIYPPLSIGLGLILVIVEAFWLATREPLWLQTAKFWTKIFALTFAIGVATGIVMEFEFGTNWATYSRYVGDVFGSALAAEGVFAFFLESGFLALLLFGWNRIPPILHFFSTVMVCLGAHFSAIWIIVANSWMQTPAGFHIVGSGVDAKAQITDFWAMVFNPSSVDRLIHAVLGAWLAGAFLVISICAYYLLKNRHVAFAKKSLTIALTVAFASTLMQALSGDSSAKGVAANQPAKLAALEGLFKTKSNAPLTLFGVVNVKEERIDYAVGIPSLLSFLAFGRSDAVVDGLDKVDRDDWPNVAVLFNTYRLMIAMWFVMLLASSLGLFFLIKGSLYSNRAMLWFLVFSVFAPQLANQVGWLSAEMGRYPWIVQGLLRISEGLSKAVHADHVFGSIIMFGLVYLFLFVLFIYLLNEKIQHGPEEHDGGDAPLYHHLQDYVEEVMVPDKRIDRNI